ncbi:hypothetical protein [Burkholderia aenigmatica]|nr:hypothetical protein [Burkholderia aenigmatica]MDN7873883.1 hypothetical protein [Burkholderia aenigmatica]
MVDPYRVVDDFGRMWDLVPDVGYFGDWSEKQAVAAAAFVRSGEVH